MFKELFDWDKKFHGQSILKTYTGFYPFYSKFPCCTFLFKLGFFFGIHNFHSFYDPPIVETTQLSFFNMYFISETMKVNIKVSNLSTN